MTVSNFACLSLLLISSGLLSAEWRTWRGPGNDGLSESTKLPETWGESENLVWKLELPAAGSSTPIVVGERIFLTFEEDGQVKATCISEKGKTTWTRAVSEAKGRGNGERTHASPTPSSDGELLFVTSGTGEVVAFDLEGEEKWRFNAQERYGKFRYGFGFHSTTVLHEGRLYLQLIHSAAQLVVCVEAKSGREVWKVERESDGVAECEHSYASAVAYRDDVLNVLVTHGNDYCIGHDPGSGKELWRVAGLNPKEKYNRTLRFVASPVVSQGFLVAPSAKNRGVSVVRLSEAKGRIGKGGAGELWRMDRGTTDVTIPLLYGGLLYLCKENGTILCLDALSGEQLYQERFHAQTYRGSPVAANGRIFLTARDGTFTVLKAGRTYEVIGKNKLDDQFTASPAIAHDRFYLRGHKSLYAIGSK